MCTAIPLPSLSNLRTHHQTPQPPTPPQKKQSPYDQTLRVDKHTSVTPIKKKNYSTDPSKSIVLEAFALEKSVRLWLLCVCGGYVHVCIYSVQTHTHHGPHQPKAAHNSTPPFHFNERPTD